MIEASLFDAPPPAAAPPTPAMLPRLAAMYRDWRDALLRVALSERSHGCIEAALVCERQAARDHDRMMAAIRSAAP